MLVDGRSVGDVGETILKERQSLGKEGVLVVIVKDKSVKLISKGFIYNEQAFYKDLEALANRIINQTKSDKSLAEALTNQLSSFINTRYERAPEVIPVIL